MYRGINLLGGFFAIILKKRRMLQLPAYFLDNETLPNEKSAVERRNLLLQDLMLLLLLLYCCFTSTVNILDHVGAVS